MKSIWLTYLAIVPPGGTPPNHPGDCYAVAGDVLYLNGEHVGTLDHYGLGGGGIQVFYTPLPATTLDKEEVRDG